jgi:hypothetical protein
MLNQEDNGDDDIWAGMSDEELLQVWNEGTPLSLNPSVCQIQAATKSKKPPLDSARSKPQKCASRPKKYETLQSNIIYENLVSYWNARSIRLSFSSIGCWTFFMDEECKEDAWLKLSHLYREGKLFGVTKISRALTSKKNHNGWPIFVHAGPCQEKAYIIDVGNKLLDILQFKQQKCGAGYPCNIYYKVYKKGPMYNGGIRYYAIPFK